MGEIKRPGLWRTRYAVPAVALAIGALSSAVTSLAVAGAGASDRVKEARYVASALDSRAAYRACARSHVDLPLRSHRPAPQALAAVLGVLRHPPPSASTLTALNEKLATSIYLDTYVNAVRFARPAFGLDWYVLVAGPPRDEVPVQDIARCIRAQSLAFRHERRRIPRRLLPATRRMFRADLLAERRLDAAERDYFARPQAGADLGWLEEKPAALSGSFAFHSSASGVFVNTAASIAEHGFIENVGTYNGRSSHSLVAGIVPDGVATLMLRFSPRPRQARPRSVRAHAINNVFVAAVPDALAKRAYTVTLRWRNTGGTTIHSLPRTR